MNNNLIQVLNQSHLKQILNLTEQLNKDIPISDLKNRQIQMFESDNYKCFGLFENKQLIAVASAWITVRLYSGKQLEIDNVIVDPTHQSKGYGKEFIAELESWANANNCETIELNTYVQNERSHKFYFNQGFKILGFHFQKHLIQ
jgi:GNAT superfamily N-acetyltransferase